MSVYPKSALSSRLCVDTQGLGELFCFEPGPAGCGNIDDGVAFEIGNGGCWVVSFDDLEKLYLAAKEARKK